MRLRSRRCPHSSCSSNIPTISSFFDFLLTILVCLDPDNVYWLLTQLKANPNWGPYPKNIYLFTSLCGCVPLLFTSAGRLFLPVHCSDSNTIFAHIFCSVLHIGQFSRRAIFWTLTEDVFFQQISVLPFLLFYKWECLKQYGIAVISFFMCWEFLLQRRRVRLSLICNNFFYFQWQSEQSSPRRGARARRGRRKREVASWPRPLLRVQPSSHFQW